MTSLGEPTRRAIYDNIVSIGDRVGRDQSADATDLVCGMNPCLLGAAVEALEETELEATLEPAVGSCCVTLRPST
jgi:hypothetical protein